MSIEIGDYLYTQGASQPDGLGVVWIAITRREVLGIEGAAVALSSVSTAEFPAHSAPELASIDWQAPLSDLTTTSTLALIELKYLTELDLPQPESIDEGAVRLAWHDYMNHRHTNCERGKPVPQPVDAMQAYQFHILEWRDGLPSPSAG